jgi:phosphatidate phosphatase LPIN
MAALRREIYLRKPHVFKMSTLRDIRNLYGKDSTPFYAGFGNRFTDQISYRTVDVPRSRIFTINSNAEVVLDLLSLNKLKMSYVNINEVVDHYFPPVSTLVKGGGEEYTDFMYWRDAPLELNEFSASESEAEEEEEEEEEQYAEEEEEEEEEEVGEGMGDSYISQASMDEGSILSGSIEEGEDYEQQQMMSSIIEDEEDADDEGDDGGDDEEEQDREQQERTQVIEVEAAAKALDKAEASSTSRPDAETKSGLAPPSDSPQESRRGSSVIEDYGAEAITGVTKLTRENGSKGQ